MKEVADAGQVPILMYHRLASGDTSEGVQRRDPYLLAESAFEEQMQYLYRSGYSTMPLSDFVSYVNGKTVLPQKPVIITFDDGNRSDYVTAYPILRRFGFAATFFVTVGSVGSPESLSVEQIRDMSHSGMATESHSLTHPYLTKLNREGIERELGESKEILESKTGKAVHFLSIPNGTYNDTVKRVAKELGYLAILTSDLGINNAKSDLYSLRRIAIKNGISLPHFASLLKGQSMLRERCMQSLRDTVKITLGIENYVLIRRRLLH